MLSASSIQDVEDRQLTARTFPSNPAIETFNNSAPRARAWQIEEAEYTRQRLTYTLTPRHRHTLL